MLTTALVVAIHSAFLLVGAMGAMAFFMIARI